MKCTECPEYTKCRSRYDLRIKRHHCLNAKEPKVYTNADRIHSMDDGNLAIFLAQTAEQGCPYPAMDCKASCEECIQKWLQQPCGEGTQCST